MPYIGWPHLEVRGWGAWRMKSSSIGLLVTEKGRETWRTGWEEQRIILPLVTIASNFVQGASISYKGGLELTCWSSPQGYDEDQVKTRWSFTVQGGLLFSGFIPLNPQHPGKVEGRGALHSGVGWPLGLSQAFWLWDHKQVTSLSEPPLLSSFGFPSKRILRQVFEGSGLLGSWFQEA